MKYYRDEANDIWEYDEDDILTNIYLAEDDYKPDFTFGIFEGVTPQYVINMYNAKEITEEEAFLEIL